MKKPATKAEREYLGRLAEMGCVICQRPAEIHHVRAGMGIGQRNSHIGGTLPLCPDHHRNGGYGVAFHAGRQQWQKNFGNEVDLLNEINEIMGVESE